MKICSVRSGVLNTKSNNYNKYLKKNNNFCSQKINRIKPFYDISFLGTLVHIVDGGEHADNMKHFANAISNDMDIKMHYVEVNPKNKNTKQLKSLETELKKLNESQDLKGQYIAIPALASVPLLNLQDQYNRVMDKDEKFVPENMKSKKENILKFLEKIYSSPSLYSTYIGYMDSANQGIEYTYGVIKEINKLVKKGAQVYVPSGHPQDETLKWLAKDRGKNEELYHLISTGEDVNNVVKKMHDEIKSNNWYDFNLLSLSDAKVVGVKNSSGAQDYMFAAYDSCITDGARGVYNFSPVRENGRIIGYSYTDTITNQYPYEEFPANNQIENLNYFVGKHISSVMASDSDIEKFKKEFNAKNVPNKLYPVTEVYTPYEIIKQKINLKGDYVDRTKKLFFRVNSSGEVIFPKCDCEGTGKPSVMSMWGSCFSTINAIARDINQVNRLKPNSQISEHEKNYDNIMQKAATSSSKDKKLLYEIVMDLDKAYKLVNPSYVCHYEPFLEMANISISQGEYSKAEGYLNNGINIACESFLQSYTEHLSLLPYNVKRYNELKQKADDYDAEYAKFKAKPLFIRWFEIPPYKPYSYGEHKEYNKYVYADKQIKDIAQMFEMMDKCLFEQNKKYPAEICRLAVDDIEKKTNRGEEIIKRRSRGVNYIGDLYNEIRPY